MYPSPHYQNNDFKTIISVIKQYPLGMLLSSENGQLLITHVPIIYNELTKKLVAHIDKNNPQTAMLVNGAKVTIIFKGPDTYLSPSVFTSTQLPTWNYIAVHITGTVNLIKEASAIKKTMIDMTHFLEGTEQKYSLDFNNSKMDSLVNYVHAFDITITGWEGKFKLSQDKIPTDQEKAKQALIKKSSKDITPFINAIYDTHS